MRIKLDLLNASFESQLGLGGNHYPCEDTGIQKPVFLAVKQSSHLHKETKAYPAAL
ncbi:MAG: hypothetical protein FWG10_09515 [Eubacteriaceae bacterium]|nr:hypothetical protein [Eubacteriaceae bacterium]